jgi:stringent starvation protein B
MDMTSSRPYLVRAMYQWIVDNGLTPHILVDATADGVAVPEQHIQDGKIVLNIAPMAIQGLTLGDDDITFSARFSGKSQSLYVPIQAVLAVYARENGQGMMFSEDEDDGFTTGSDSDEEPDPDKPKPTLRVVK